MKIQCKSKIFVHTNCHFPYLFVVNIWNRIVPNPHAIHVGVLNKASVYALLAGRMQVPLVMPK